MNILLSANLKRYQLLTFEYIYSWRSFLNFILTNGILVHTVATKRLRVGIAC